MSACYDMTITFVNILDKAFLVVFACKTSFAVGMLPQILQLVEERGMLLLF